MFGAFVQSLSNIRLPSVGLDGGRHRREPLDLPQVIRIHPQADFAAGIKLDDSCFILWLHKPLIIMT